METPVGDEDVRSLADDHEPDPAPRTVSAIASRSSGDSTSRNNAAGPPIRKVVSVDIGNRARTRSPQRFRRMASASSSLRSRRLSDRHERRVAEHPHVAAPHRDDEVAGAHLPLQEPHDVGAVRQVDHALRGVGERDHVDHELSGDAGDRLLGSAVRRSRR